MNPGLFIGLFYFRRNVHDLLNQVSSNLISELLINGLYGILKSFELSRCQFGYCHAVFPKFGNVIGIHLPVGLPLVQGGFMGCVKHDFLFFGGEGIEQFFVDQQNMGTVNMTGQRGEFLYFVEL